jgi:hypothetical protein
MTTETTEDWGRKVVAGNASQSAFYATHGGRDDVAGPDTVYVVFDADLGDFVAAFESQREATDRMHDLDREAHDFGSGNGGWVAGKYVYRFSVDKLPEDHPLGQDLR